MSSRSTAPRRPRALTRLLPPILWAALIFLLSSVPGKRDMLPSVIPHLDKLAHLVAYGILGALVARAGRREWFGSWMAWGLVSWAIGSLYGATDEWHQMYVVDRSASWIDWLMDTLGTAGGVAYWLNRWSLRDMRRNEAPSPRTETRPGA